MKRLIILLFVLSVYGRELCAQTLQRTGRLYDRQEAVAGDYTGFCQDNDGFLWVSSNKGLLRFDGNSYDLYTHDERVEGSLSDNRVLGVMCDSRGNVWANTANGLNLYEPASDTFRVIDLPQHNFGGYVISIAEQSDGVITFVVSGIGIFIIDGSGGVPEAVRYFAYSPYNKDIVSIACAPSGRIYLGSHDGYVYSVAKNGQWNRITIDTDSYITDMTVEESGSILVSNAGDIYRIDGKSENVTKLSSPVKLDIHKLSNRMNGKVYVATAGNGLWEIGEGEDEVRPATEIYCPFINLGKANIGAAFCAPDGNLWLGCNYYGIVLVPGKQIPFLYRKLIDTFPDFGGGLTALSEWRGNVIAGLDKGRVAMFSPDGTVKMDVRLPVRGTITSIEVIEGDKALVGVAQDGIRELDLKTGNIKKIIDVPGKYPSIFTCRGNGDDLFIGVHGQGLLRYNMKTGARERIEHDPDGNRLTNPFMTTMVRMPDDKIWIGLYGGLACYDLEKDMLMEIDQTPFREGATYAIAQGRGNSVVIGTSHGLIHYNPAKGEIKKFTTSHGLTDNEVRAIVTDSNGGKWIGTMQGLSYQTPDNGKIFSYHGGYGLIETAFMRMVMSPGTGRVYLGSNLGITSFSPDAVPSPGFDREIKISALYLNGHKLTQSSLNGGHDAEDGQALYPENLNLPYKDNALTLRLSTMDFRDASNVSYIWRIGGKGEWIQSPPGENMIYLPHLDPGDHELEICALENNVTSAPAQIRLHISTPWYMTVAARLVYFAVLVTIIILGYLVMKKDREEKINDAKIKYFIDVSHDIRSPMTLILSPLNSLMKYPFDEDVKAKLKTIHRNAQRILSLVNQMLDIRKLDTGKMTLHCRPTNLNNFVRELVEMFQTQASDKKQELLFRESDEIGEVWLDRDNFDKIMVNLISNALKYTPAEGKIEVTVRKSDDEKMGRCASVSVADSGIGLDNKTKAKIFDRFYRDRDKHAPGTDGFGIGLDLCRRLVELHHGRIMADNREDGEKGSVFEILIPLNPALYDQSELILTDNKSEEEPAHTVIPSATDVEDQTVRSVRPGLSGKKVLVVDDDEELRHYLGTHLEKNYKVKEAKDGAEALKIVGEWQPDLIVSDVIMPEVDGLSLLKRIKSHSDTNHIPVVLLSSKTELSDRMAAWDRGADGYIGKPFNIEELDALIDTLIENRLRLRGKYSGAQETEGKITPPEMKGNDEALIDRIMKEINRQIDDPQLNVEKLAADVGVSRAHLHRRMKEIMGMTPSDFIRNIRLKRACELLRRPDIEVTQVAYKIGFNSQPHFSTHFKRYTGFTPSEYRARSLAGEQMGDTPEKTSDN